MTNFVMKMHFVKNNTNNQKFTNKNMTNNNNNNNNNVTNKNITNIIKLRNRTISSHLLFNNMFLSNNSSGCGCGK